jgi:hypothetical protein
MGTGSYAAVGLGSPLPQILFVVVEMPFVSLFSFRNIMSTKHGWYLSMPVCPVVEYTRRVQALETQSGLLYLLMQPDWYLLLWTGRKQPLSAPCPLFPGKPAPHPGSPDNAPVLTITTTGTSMSAARGTVQTKIAQ